MLPTSFPVQNTHRLVVHLPDLHRSDLDRIEDIGADAIADARAADLEIERLPNEVFNVLGRHHRAFTDAVEGRRVLSEDYRQNVAAMLRLLATAEVLDEAAEAGRDRVSRALRDALNLSHRVADLLAAEKDIGWQRGIRA